MAKLPEIEWTPQFEETHEYYDREDEERLGHRSLYEYLESELCDSSIELDKAIAENEVIDVFAYQRTKFPRRSAEFLDRLLDRLSDSEDMLCDPESEGFDLSDSEMAELRALEQQFIDELEKRITVWGCEPVAVIKVPFRDWWESLSDKDREILRG